MHSSIFVKNRLIFGLNRSYFKQKTPQIFTWEGVDLKDTKTRQHAVGKGTKGYDFLIGTNLQFVPEWKGPNVNSVEDVAQVMLKLFSQQLDETIQNL